MSAEEEESTESDEEEDENFSDFDHIGNKINKARFDAGIFFCFGFLILFVLNAKYFFLELRRIAKDCWGDSVEPPSKNVCNIDFCFVLSFFFLSSSLFLPFLSFFHVFGVCKKNVFSYFFLYF